MNHAEIEELEITDRYLRGKLPPEDAARFEEHYLYCQECLDRLELAESMSRGFKRAAGQDAARVAASRQIALLAWLARLGRSPRMAALAMAVLVVAVLPGLIGLREIRERDQILAETRSALKQERQRSAAAGSKTAAEAARLQELEARLERAQEAQARAEKQRDEALQPQSNIPILFLDTERGAGEPTNRLHLPRTPGWVVLELGVDSPNQPIQPSYSAVLRNEKGKEIWRWEGLRPNEGLATLSLHSTLLEPGVYTVTVGGRRLPFRVLPPA